MDELTTQPITYSTAGGRLCLDFCNTLSGRHPLEVSHTKLQTHYLVEQAEQNDTNDHLKSYADLVEFARQMGLVTHDEMRILLAEAARRPVETEITLQQAKELREVMYRIFSAYQDGQAPPADDVARFNMALAEAMWHAQLVYEGAEFRWGWRADVTALDRVVWPIIRSAADVLTSEDLKRVRECEGETCGWLFLDTSKNHSRRWCSMEDCGNRAKAKRHYHRVKKQPT